MAEKAQAINKRLDELESPEAICEENYDDLDTVAEQVQIQLKNGTVFPLLGCNYGNDKKVLNWD